MNRQSALRHIRYSSIAGIIYGLASIPLSLHSGDLPILGIVIFGLSFGTYKKSRLCAALVTVLFAVNSLISVTDQFIDMAEFTLGFLAIPLVLGIKATFAYNRLDKIAEFEIDPKNSIECFNKSLALRQSERYEEALRYCDWALRTTPTMAVAWNNKGAILQKLGKYERAIECYEKALEIIPTYHIALYNKAVSLSLLEKHDEAIVCCTKTIETYPDYGDAWFNRGRLRIKKGEINDGLEDWKAAMTINRELYSAKVKEDVDTLKKINSDEAFRNFGKLA